MSAIYLETSALLRALFKDEGSDEVVARIQSASRVITSRLTRIEAERALIRLSLENPKVEKFSADLERDLRELWARIDIVEMHAAICELAGRISPKSRLRSLDAIHLATFRWLRQREGAIEMLTFDDRIRAELL